MARRSKKQKPEPEVVPDAEPLPPVNVLAGSMLVCYEDGFVSFGPVTHIR